MNKMRLLIATTLAAAAIPAFATGPNHMVLSEIAVRGGLYDSGHESSEFVEIYNPTGAAINDLNHYYVTDWAQYYTLPGLATMPDLGGGDFLAQFPATASPVASGGVVVVTANAKYFLDAYFGGSYTAFTSQPGSPQLFEIQDSDALTGVTVPDMINLNTEAGENATNLSHSDGGENQFLFYWDGASDLVQDVDMMQYAEMGADLGLSNGFRPKTGESVDGPDVDAIASTYLADNGSTANLAKRFQPCAGADRPYQYFRSHLEELGEIAGVGNGITGDDESMEQINLTWTGTDQTTTTATPGVTPLGLSSDNAPPVVILTDRSAVFPTPGSTLTFTAHIMDDGTVASAKVVVDSGSGPADIAMINTAGNTWSADYTVPAAGTIVKYHVEATDNQSASASENDYLTFYPGYPGYHQFTVVASAPNPGDIKFTELLIDPHGGDNAAESEFVELYNSTSGPIDISGGRFAISSATDLNHSLTFPSGTIIPSKGYLVLAAWKPLFLLRYPGYDPSKVLDLQWPRSSTLSNGSNSVYFLFANQLNTNGQPNVAMDEYSYTTSTSTDGDANTGYTRELKDQTGPNSSDSDWAPSLVPGGTPGQQASIDNPANMSITNNVRTIQFPKSTDDIVINADVTANSLSTVLLYYTTNPGLNYVSTPMTLVSGTQYTKNLGAFPDGTLIKYFVQATDTSGQVLTGPQGGIPITFRVEDVTPTDADLVITEIMSDPSGTENVVHSEWVEVFNRSDHAIDMSFYKMGHVLDTYYARTLPEGTVIQSKGYFIFAGNKPVFEAQYTSVDPNLVFDALYVASIISNGSANEYLSHLNSLNFNELTWDLAGTAQLDVVPYFDNSNGWPNTTGDISRELTDVTADNTVGTNWAVTLVSGGTPAFENSTSGVNDWSIY